MADGGKAPDANAILRVEGPDGLRAAFDYAGNGMPTACTRRPTPYRWCDPEKLPKREWLMGRYLCRGVLSMTVAPGGTGKSTLAQIEAVALASGRDLLLGGVSGPACVWYWNLEEPMEELRRRVQAVCKHFHLSEHALTGRLFVDSGLERGLCLARPLPGHFEVVEDVFVALETAIRQQGVDVLIIDPFVSSHQLEENNNMQMDAVMKRLSKLAVSSNCAVSIVHHTRKPTTDGRTTTESARGGKSITDAARIVRVLNPMTKEQAAQFGVELAGVVSARLDKQNYAAPTAQADWYQLVSIELGNGDEVGVVQHWRPLSMKADLSEEQITRIRDRCAASVPGLNIQATDWAGKIVAEVLGLNVHKPDEKRRTRIVLKQLLADGYLKEDRRPKPGKTIDRPVVLPGKDPGA